VSDPGSSGSDADPDAPSSWLIFATGPGELGVHPVIPDGRDRPRREISLVCDDISATIAELTARGARFRGEPEDRGYGICVEVEVPGTDDIQIYEPRHRTAFDLAGRGSR
jgi:hypothetical protein